jgi:hypothetical protein
MEVVVSDQRLCPCEVGNFRRWIFGIEEVKELGMRPSRREGLARGRAVNPQPRDVEAGPSVFIELVWAQAPGGAPEAPDWLTVASDNARAAPVASRIINRRIRDLLLI